MRKIIAAFNMTLDGFCDHTTMVADDEIHHHYNELLKSSGVLVYGRTTYQLMESYWPAIVKNPTGNKMEDEFAVLIEGIPKIVFSHTLHKVEWNNATLAKESFPAVISALSQQPGKDILVGSRSLIVDSLNLNLFDEFQITVQPIIAGKGLPLLNNITDRINLTLLKTKTFNASGSITLYYAPAKK